MNLLVVGPAWVGDMVIAHSLVRTLRAQDASRDIHMVAPPATAPLATRMAGIAQCHELTVAHGHWGWGARRSLGKNLRAVGFEQAIVLPNSFKSALVPVFAHVPRRTGWMGEWRYGVLNDVRRLDPGSLPRLVDRFVALAGDAGALPKRILEPQLTANAERAAELVEWLQLDADGSVLALCPGAEYGPAKRWPAAHYATIATAHLERDHPVWMFGARGDGEMCRQITATIPARLQPKLFDLSGRTTLLDAVDLLSLTDQVVTNDSGLMHVACALGRRVIAIFGSTSPEFTPPLSEDARIVRNVLPCSPCFRRSCPLGHTNCLNELVPERVLAELNA